MNAQPPPERSQNATKTDAANEDQLKKVIQEFFDDFDKTKPSALQPLEAATNNRKAVCERVLSDLRPLAQKGYAAAQWALAQAYLAQVIPSVSGLRDAFCPSVESGKEGIVWLKRAADKGVWAARVRLAQIYATAEAGSLDLIEAYALYDVTKKGQERLCLSKLMSVEDIERAQVLATKYGTVPDPQMMGFKMIDVALPSDYCAEEYRQVVRPGANVGTDAAQIDSDLAKLTSTTHSALADFPVTSPLYRTPDGTRYNRGELVASLNVYPN